MKKIKIYSHNAYFVDAQIYAIVIYNDGIKRVNIYLFIWMKIYWAEL